MATVWPKAEKMAEIEAEVDRLFTDTCPNCQQPYSGEFDEHSWRYQSQYLRFDRDTQIDWGDQDHLDEDRVLGWGCTECGDLVPPDLQELIAIYRGNVTLYADPEKRP